jgi:hypothetical protein
MAQVGPGGQLAQGLAAFAARTVATGETGTAAQTGTARVLTRLLVKEGLGPGGGKLAGETGFDRLIDFLNKLEAGQFGTSSEARAQAVKRVSEEASDIAMLLNLNVKQLSAAVDAFAAGMGTSTAGDIQSMMQLPGAQQRMDAQMAQRQRELADILDVSGASIEEQRRQTAAAASARGLRLTSQFPGLEQIVSGVSSFLPADVQRRRMQRELSRATEREFGLDPSQTALDVLAGTPVGPAAALARRLGIGVGEPESVEEIEARAFREGRIRLDDGLSRAESTALARQGFSAAELEQLSAAIVAGNRELIQAATERIAELGKTPRAGGGLD